MTVAIDFDGVIHTYEKGWHDGTIYGDFLPDAMPAIETLMEHDAVFVHTTRNARQVAAWIQRTSGYNIDCTTRLPRTWYGRRKPFWNTRGLLLVTNVKLPAVAYLDDRAVRFHDWKQGLTALGVTPRLLDCGWCYEEWGEEVHPHPECPIGGADVEQGAPTDWQSVVQTRERELKEAQQRAQGALDVIHEWQRDGTSNDYLTRVHRALNPPVSGTSAST
jgi:hypothetical protein